jgi:hypothetical protein
MVKLNRFSLNCSFWSIALLAIGVGGGCTQQSQQPPQPPGAKKISAGQEFSGFLKDYSNLKPNPRFEGNALTHASVDAQKNLHKYIGVLVDPVEVYLASDADAAKIEEKTRAAAARYFQHALMTAVSSAYPVVEEKGPLVLRLRAAIIGVDVGGEVAAADRPPEASQAVGRAMNIGKVGVEMELLDSESGEQIAAMVDRTNLGAGAEVASANLTRHEKSLAAREAFDEWARRVRDFLDAANELSPEDQKRAEASYQPYGSEKTGR